MTEVVLNSMCGGRAGPKYETALSTRRPALSTRRLPVSTRWSVLRTRWPVLSTMRPVLGTRRLALSTRRPVLLQPHFRPTYFSPTSAFLKPYFNPASALRTPALLQSTWAWGPPVTARMAADGR